MKMINVEDKTKEEFDKALFDLTIGLKKPFTQDSFMIFLLKMLKNNGTSLTKRRVLPIIHFPKPVIMAKEQKK